MQTSSTRGSEEENQPDNALNYPESHRRDPMRDQDHRGTERDQTWSLRLHCVPNVSPVLRVCARACLCVYIFLFTVKHGLSRWWLIEVLLISWLVILNDVHMKPLNKSFSSFLQIHPSTWKHRHRWFSYWARAGQPQKTSEEETVYCFRCGFLTFSLLQQILTVWAEKDGRLTLNKLSKVENKENNTRMKRPPLLLLLSFLLLPLSTVTVCSVSDLTAFPWTRYTYRRLRFQERKNTF